MKTKQLKKYFLQSVLILSILFVFADKLKAQSRDNVTPVVTTLDESASLDFEISKNLDVFYTLFRELNIYYVDELDPGQLIKYSIDEMLESLDPYTVYYPESQIEEYKFMTTGQYGGVGASVNLINDKFIVLDVFQDYPSDRAGLKIGDVILEIDGISMIGKKQEELNDILKGSPQTTLKIKVERPGEASSIDFSIERENIKIKNVPYYGMIDDNTAYIKLTGFTEDAAKEVHDALVEMQTNKNAKALILDLRNNPGGLLIEAVRIVNLFVDRGQEIVSTKGKVSLWNKTYATEFDPIDKNIPVTVLINSRSASASEIVAGALQDLDRAVIVGQRSFGKGLVQTTRSLTYNTKMKLTTAKYYIPSGRCIQALDYSHRNEDGSVGKVPDSLITVFETKNGRKVMDGGGIIPDTDIEARKYSQVATSLSNDLMIFDFATLYAINHDTIDNIENFTISDKDYADFITYIKSRNFSYETESEEALNALIDKAKAELYYDKSEAEFLALKQKLGHDMDTDLQNFSEEIKYLLNLEIVGRYYYNSGRIKYQLKNDKEIQQATQILTNKQRYDGILSGTVVSEKQG